MPLLLRVLEYFDDLDIEPKLSRSLFVSMDPLPCAAIGSCQFLSGNVTHVIGAPSAVLAMFAFFADGFPRGLGWVRGSEG